MDLFILPEREHPMPSSSLMSRAGVMAVPISQLVPERIRGLVFERVYVLPGLLLNSEQSEFVATLHRPMHERNSKFVYGNSARDAWEQAKALMSILLPETKKPDPVKLADAALKASSKALFWSYLSIGVNVGSVIVHLIFLFLKQERL